MFWNARATSAAPQVWMRAEGAGHLAQLDLDADRRGGARDRRRPDEPWASRRGDTRLHPVQHRHRMGAGRPGRAVAAAACPTASTRPTPPRRCSTCARTRAPRILFVEDDEQLDKALEVREQLPRLRKIVVFDMEGLRDLDDPSVISLDAAARAGPRSTRRSIPASWTQRVAALPARRPGDPGLHLGHHRQAQGRDAQRTTAWSTPCAATTR